VHAGKAPMPEAIVVGAGVAGISAALHLTQRGWRVVLLEAQHRIGGRAASLPDPHTGELLDTGQHVLLGNYRELLALLCELGSAELLGPAAPLRFALCRSGGERHWFEPARLPGRLGFLYALWRLPRLRWSERLRVLSAVAALLSGAALQGTVEQFLRRFRQPIPAVESFWEPLTLATLNTTCAEADVRMLAVVLRRGFLGSAAGARLIIPNAPLQALLEPVGQWLQQRGGILLLGARVKRLLLEQSRRVGVELEEGKQLWANALVLAVPPWSAQRLLQSAGLSAELPEFAYSPIVTVYLWLRRAVLPARMCALLGTLFQWVFVHPSTVAACRVALVCSAADTLAELPHTAIAERAREELLSAFPELSAADILHQRVLMERRATLRLRPELARLRPSGRLPHPAVVLAGDWLQTGLPCTLEGAARSGRRAAEWLHRELAKRLPR
jgi:squalene-associated FAD-dependent desaturase